MKQNKRIELINALKNKQTNPIIILGPPNSGKTTLINSVLNELKIKQIEINKKTNTKYFNSNEIGIIIHNKIFDINCNVIIETNKFIKLPNSIIIKLGNDNKFKLLGGLFYKNRIFHDKNELFPFIYKSYYDFMELKEIEIISGLISEFYDFEFMNEIVVIGISKNKKIRPGIFYQFKNEI